MDSQRKLSIKTTYMENVISAIEEITTEGGDQNFCIIYLTEDYYLQFTSQKGSNEIYCEAVSNQFLSQDLHLTEAQEDQLFDLGWEEPDFGNYYTNMRIGTSESKMKLIEFIMDTAKKVYGHPITEDTEFTIELE
jgi:hypothetical protein